MIELAIYALAVTIIAIAVCMWVFPIYGVWASRKAGEAAYADAIGDQRIQVAQAQSRLDAAELNKKAAIIEAEAVSAQIKEIGTELHTHELYLRWQWIEMMRDRDADADTIYVPTEANLPILEATRRNG